FSRKGFFVSKDGTNRLKESASPYLRSAAHQPIDWHEWGDAAFDRAKAEDKPILLDIGAVWCHWCHVIDRESYENPEIAKIINEHFVAIKVDRDQRHYAAGRLAAHGLLAAGRKAVLRRDVFSTRGSNGTAGIPARAVDRRG